MTIVGDKIRRAGHLPIFGTVGLALHLLSAASRQIVGLVAIQIILTFVPGLLLNRFAGGIAGPVAVGTVDFVVEQAIFAISNGAIFAIAYAVSRRRPCTIGAAFSASGVRFWAMLLVGMFQALPSQIEDLLPKTSWLFATATLVVYLLTATAQPVCMIEGPGPISSLGRAIAMTRGNRWRVVGLVVASALVALTFLLATSLLAVPIAGLGSLLLPTGMPWLLRFGGYILGFSVVIVPLSLLALMPMALYINLRAIEIGDVPRSGLDEIGTVDANVVT